MPNAKTGNDASRSQRFVQRSTIRRDPNNDVMNALLTEFRGQELFVIRDCQALAILGVGPGEDLLGFLVLGCGDRNFKRHGILDRYGLNAAIMLEAQGAPILSGTEALQTRWPFRCS